MSMPSEDVSLKDKTSQVLEEIRVVMPGSQALLGFQLVALFSSNFASLPQGIKEVHLASLACIATATIFLMAPSAYHRIAHRGRNVSDVHRFASGMLVIAMFFLIIGLSADLWVATLLVLESTAHAWRIALTCFVAAVSLWFIYPIVRRHRGGE